MLPQPFHGRPEESLAAYLRDYDSCLKTNGYVGRPDEGEADPNRDRLDQMRIFLLQRGLQGPAALVLESLSDEDRDDPDKLRAALVARFGDKGKSMGIKCILGAVDGCHIPLKAPVEDPLSYVNRKGFHSVLLQGVCDHELLGTDVYCGGPGRVCDARVFSNLPLLDWLQTLSPDTHNIGDRAYPLSMSPLLPYKDNPTNGQQVFNNRLSMAWHC